MCECCDGTQEIAQSMEQSGNTYVLSRATNDDGVLENYFVVEEYDSADNLRMQTFTPDMKYCPWCGAIL